MERRTGLAGLRKFLLIAALGPLIGLISIVGLFTYARMTGESLELQPMVWVMVHNTLWGLFLPLIVHWSERDPLRPGAPGALFLRHAWRFLVYCLGAVATIGIVRWLAHLAFGTQALSPADLVGRVLGGWLIYDALMYFLLWGVVSAMVAQRELRERQVAAAEREATLAQAETKLLKSELDPHFLFNALNTITASVYRDPAAAETMLCRLSDFLRLSLATASSLEVTLRQELEHLRAYMAIQMVRFRGRLLFEVSVSEELGGCLVPNLLLQPLVENIVKHAVAVSYRVVHAGVRAWRNDRQLFIEVIDDGPGLPAPEARKEGVGLTNTRGRLLRLYGKNQRLTLESGVSKGTLVLIVLPHHFADGDPAVDGDAPPEVMHDASRTHC